jgi:hypothetical protein
MTFATVDRREGLAISSDGCFVPQRGENLLFAGRCLSAEHEAVASARVTAQCFSYGHAIGHAATIAVREQMRPRETRGEDVRMVLNRDGAQLGAASAAALMV